MKSCPDISFVITVYNTEPYLPEALDKLLGCKFGDLSYEIIIVDDFSPGDPNPIVSNYKSKCDIRTVRHDENHGNYRAKITGYSMAKGNYVMVLDSDDFVVNIDFESLIKQAYERNLEIIQVPRLAGASLSSLEKSKIVELSAQKEIFFEDHDKFWPWFTQSMNWTVTNTIYSRALVNKVLEYLDADVDGILLSDDFCLGAPLAYFANRFAYIPNRGFFFYRLNPSSVCHNSWNTREKVKKSLINLVNARKIIEKFSRRASLSKTEESLLWECYSINLPWVTAQCIGILKTNPDLFVLYIDTFPPKSMSDFMFSSIEKSWQLDELESKAQKYKKIELIIAKLLPLHSRRRSVVKKIVSHFL